MRRKENWATVSQQEHTINEDLKTKQIKTPNGGNLKRDKNEITNKTNDKIIVAALLHVEVPGKSGPCTKTKPNLTLGQNDHGWGRRRADER